MSNINSVTVYVKNDCPQCKFATRLMDSMYIDYETINVDENEKAREFLVNEGYKMIPVTFTKDDKWAGFSPTKIKSLRNK